MAKEYEYKFRGEVDLNYGNTFYATKKTPAIAKRIFDTYEHALAFVNDFQNTAIPGITLSVILDNDESKKGLYYVTKVASGIDTNDGELIKIDDMSITIDGGTYD